MAKRGIDILVARRTADVGQADIARAYGINPATLIDIEKNRIGIDDETFESINTAISKAASKKTASVA